MCIYLRITTQNSHITDNTEIKQLRIRVRSVSGDISSKPSKLIKTELQNMEIQTAIYFKMRAMINASCDLKEEGKTRFCFGKVCHLCKKWQWTYYFHPTLDEQLEVYNMGILRTEEVTNKYIINKMLYLPVFSMMQRKMTFSKLYCYFGTDEKHRFLNLGSLSSDYHSEDRIVPFRSSNVFQHS